MLIVGTEGKDVHIYNI